MPEADRKALIDAVLREIISDPDASYRSIAVLYQDFLVRCRIHRLPGEPLDLPAFRRRLTIARAGVGNDTESRSEEHTSELQSLMRISYAVFCLNKKNVLKHINT